MTNHTSHEYFANPVNRLKQGELSRSNWKRADYRKLQLWRKGVHLSPKSEFKKGQRSPRYMPIGTTKVKCGYKIIKVAERGRMNQNWEFEHVVVMSRYIGRSVVKGEHIHHINGDKLDNRIENLYLCGNSKHSKLHSLVHLLKPLLENGSIKFDMDKGEYYAT